MHLLLIGWLVYGNYNDRLFFKWIKLQKSATILKDILFEKMLNLYFPYWKTVFYDYRYAIGNAQRPMVKIGWLDILANDTQEHYFPNNTGGGPSIKVSQNNRIRSKMILFRLFRKICFCVSFVISWMSLTVLSSSHNNFCMSCSSN